MSCLAHVNRGLEKDDRRENEPRDLRASILDCPCELVASVYPFGEILYNNVPPFSPITSFLMPAAGALVANARLDSNHSNFD